MAATIVYYLQFALGGTWVLREKLSPNPVDWALFGDYLGGTLGSAFGLLGLLALLYTVRLQIEELQISNTELAQSTKALTKQEKSISEQTGIVEQERHDRFFFGLLEVASRAVESVTYRSQGKLLRGKEAIALITCNFQVFGHDDAAKAIENGGGTTWNKCLSHDCGQVVDTICEAIRFASQMPAAERLRYLSVLRSTHSIGERKLCWLAVHAPSNQGMLTKCLQALFEDETYAAHLPQMSIDLGNGTYDIF